MNLCKDINKFSGINPVVTVGIFDGVHMGHRFILERLREAAHRFEGESTLVTLWPHPRTILNQVDESFRLLNNMEEKTAMLEEEGLDHLVVIPFTRSFSQLSSCEFIEEYLHRKIGIRHLVVGFNHRFGRDREGNYDKLNECAGKFGFSVEEVPPLTLEAGEVSSSNIRENLLSGDVVLANQLLGWNYSFSGEVVEGSKLGTTIGFPTANIIPGESYKILPAEGVYAVRARLNGDSFHGMLNIGSRPTVNEDPNQKTIEVHLLDFEKNIYNEQIRIEFVERLRNERKFTGIDALGKQLKADLKNTRDVFRK
jgi:riboflavin kinase/FMN adenylyltransferase